MCSGVRVGMPEAIRLTGREWICHIQHEHPSTLLAFLKKTNILLSHLNPCMESPLVSFELKESYLLVIGHGSRDNLASMVEASAKIYEKVNETQMRYLLVDYRNLRINVNMSEAFNIVKRYETAQPRLKDITIAAVFGTDGLNFGRYWKEISKQRGFSIEIFENFDIAEAWLLKQREV